MIEDGVRGLAKQPWCNLSSCSRAPRNVLQAHAIFPDKLVASSAIGDLPLAVALTNIPLWEQSRVNQKSGLHR